MLGSMLGFSKSNTRRLSEASTHLPLRCCATFIVELKIMKGWRESNFQVGEKVIFNSAPGVYSGVDGGGRRPLTSFYEMICHVRVRNICDQARVWRPPTSYGVHPLLMTPRKLFFRTTTLLESVSKG